MRSTFIDLLCISVGVRLKANPKRLKRFKKEEATEYNKLKEIKAQRLKEVYKYGDKYSIKR